MGCPKLHEGWWFVSAETAERDACPEQAHLFSINIAVKGLAITHAYLGRKIFPKSRCDAEVAEAEGILQNELTKI